MAKFGTLEYVTEQADKAREAEAKRMQELIQQEGQRMQEQDRQQRQKILDDQRAAETNRHIDELKQAVQEASAQQALPPQPVKPSPPSWKHSALVVHDSHVRQPQPVIKLAPIVHHNHSHPMQVPTSDLDAYDSGTAQDVSAADKTDPYIESERMKAKLRGIAAIREPLAKHIGEGPAKVVTVAVAAAAWLQMPIIAVAAVPVGFFFWFRKRQAVKAAEQAGVVNLQPAVFVETSSEKAASVMPVVDRPATKMMPLSDVPGYRGPTAVETLTRSRPRRHGKDLQPYCFFFVGLLAVGTTLTIVAAFVIWYTR